MSDAALVARWQFKTIEWRTGDRTYGLGACFWARIFAITFATGVVTGIPLEFQFGTNWARFSHVAGPVVGQTLFMEGVFAFFAESSVGALIVTTLGSVVDGLYPMLLPSLNPGVHPGLDLQRDLFRRQPDHGAWGLPLRHGIGRAPYGERLSRLARQGTERLPLASWEA